MSSNNKSKDLIPKIINAGTKKEAIEVLNDVLEALYLTNNYTDIVRLKDSLTEYKERYRKLTDKYEKSDRDIQSMLGTRTDLNFLYRDISDKFSFDINRLKIFYEECKTSVRAESMKNLKADTEIQEIFNAKSTSSLRDIVGLSDTYREFIANYSIAYGLFKDLETLLTSVRMFTDLLASSIKTEQTILMKDVK